LEPGMTLPLIVILPLGSWRFVSDIAAGALKS
jgi:hypothetical protein